MNKEDEMCVEEGEKEEGVEGRSCHGEEAVPTSNNLLVNLENDLRLNYSLLSLPLFSFSVSFLFF